LDPATRDRAAKLLADRLHDVDRATLVQRADDADVRWCLAAGIAILAEGMEPANATRICGLALPHVATALVEKGDFGSPMAAVTIRSALGVLSSSDSANVSQAARIMAKALPRTELNSSRREVLISALHAVAGRIPRDEVGERVQALVPVFAREQE
jgi:hypothetical protein